ncbi:MAG: hypothetical protein ACHREM_20385 [Polyangiales bacterium]
MSIKTLIERAVRASQDDFSSLLESKLAVLLAGDVTTPPSASRPRVSRKLATTPTRASRVRIRPEAKAGGRSKAAPPVVPVNVNAVAEVRAPVPVPATDPVEEYAIDLPILRAIAHEDAVTIVGNDVTESVLAELRRATGLRIEAVSLVPETVADVLVALGQKVVEDHVVGLIVVDVAGLPSDVATVLTTAKMIGVAFVFAADATVASLISALGALEYAASGPPTHS